MEERKINVDTALGKLCACVGGDPNYLEIFVYIERPDGVEIDLVAAEVDAETNAVSAYLYGDTSTEEWTKKHVWTEADINIDMEDDFTMSDETMYTLEVGFNRGDAVKIPGVFCSKEKAKEVYKKCYAATFPYYAIGGEPVYQ